VIDEFKISMKGILVLMIVLSVYSCNSKKNEAAKEQQSVVTHVFYYYPKPNIYLDTTSKTYFYFDSTKKGWQTVHLPTGMEDDMGKGVLIPHPSKPVWSDNREHRLEYSVTLYADSSDFKSPKVAKKPVVIKHEEKPQQKKSKVRNFFDRLFHKKRK